MYLEDYGNTGIPGEWVFQIDSMRIIRCKPGVKGDTCDERTLYTARTHTNVYFFSVHGTRMGPRLSRVLPLRTGRL